MTNESLAPLPWYDQSICGCTNRSMCAQHYHEAQAMLGSPYECVSAPLSTSSEGMAKHDSLIEILASIPFRQRFVRYYRHGWEFLAGFVLRGLL